MYRGSGLLADREKEEWWEHYIAVKLDLVENILGDDTAVEEQSSGVRATPSTADDIATPGPGTLLHALAHSHLVTIFALQLGGNKIAAHACRGMHMLLTFIYSL